MYQSLVAANEATVEKFLAIISELTEANSYLERELKACHCFRATVKVLFEIYFFSCFCIYIFVNKEKKNQRIVVFCFNTHCIYPCSFEAALKFWLKLLLVHPFHIQWTIQDLQQLFIQGLYA